MSTQTAARLGAIRQAIELRSKDLPARDQRRVIARACTLHRHGHSAACAITDAKRFVSSIRAVAIRAARKTAH